MHLVVILFIALIVFGPKKLPELGKGLGEAIRGFKDSIKAADAPPGPGPGDEGAAGEQLAGRKGGVTLLG